AGIGIPGPRHDWRGPSSPDDPENVAPLVVYFCTGESPNANGYVFGVRGGEIYLYTNPEVDRAIYQRGLFAMDELDDLVPRFISRGM
ncbi:MAG: hypothetical protein HY531_00465, partial [Chloroflexi bacterium]|nr:hypothetical protein [Chloroflexota bacterium]